MRRPVRAQLSLALSGALLGAIALSAVPTAAGARVAHGSAGSGVVEYVGVVKGAKPYVNGAPQKDAYFVAIAVRPNGKVLAYTCDGFGEKASFSGNEKGGSFTATDGESTIEATITRNHARGTLDFEGTDWDFDLRRARGIGGLYTIGVKAGANGAITAAGRSERGNTFRTRARAGATDLTFTFTTTDGRTRTATPTPLNPPAELLGFDGYRAIFLDNGRMGRGSPLVAAVAVQAPTPLSTKTLQTITSTVIQFY